jgi:hypothetical protein
METLYLNEISLKKTVRQVPQAVELIDFMLDVTVKKVLNLSYWFVGYLMILHQMRCQNNEWGIKRNQLSLHGTIRL